MKVWAWSGGVSNFGDELGPAILERLGRDFERVLTIQEADLLACGSLLEDAAVNAKPGAAVWGSGLMYGAGVSLSRLDVRAVRGRLTTQACDLSGVVTADPGALVPDLWPKPPTRRNVGVVRHYVDQEDYAWADATIDATAPVDEVIEFIGSCRRVASSSLHGLIVAHAWHLPTLRLPHPGVAGGDFKWADWLSGLDDPARLVEVLP